MRDQISDGIAQQQAQRRDTDADGEGTLEELQVDALIRRLADDRAFEPAIEVDGMQVVPHGKAVPSRADRVPCPRIAPILVDANQGVAPGSGGHVPGSAA